MSQIETDSPTQQTKPFGQMPSRGWAQPTWDHPATERTDTGFSWYIVYLCVEQEWLHRRREFDTGNKSVVNAASFGITPWKSTMWAHSMWITTNGEHTDRYCVCACANLMSLSTVFTLWSDWWSGGRRILHTEITADSSLPHTHTPSNRSRYN